MAQDEDIETVDATVDTEEPTEEAEEEVPFQEEVVEVDDDLRPGLVPSPDAETTVFLPDFSDYTFPAGSTVTVIVGFKNIGSGSFRINDVEASFRFPGDFSYSMWNFTQVFTDTLVESGDLTTIFYQFRPHENFEPREFGFVVNVNYFDGDGAQFQDAVINRTCNVIERTDEFDWQGTILYTVLIGSAGAFLYYFISGKITKSSHVKRTALIERGTSNSKQAAASVNNEWLSDLNVADVKKKKTPKKAEDK